VQFITGMLNDMSQSRWTFYKPLEKKEFKLFASRSKSYQNTELIITDSSKLKSVLVAQFGKIFQLIGAPIPVYFEETNTCDVDSTDEEEVAVFNMAGCDDAIVIEITAHKKDENEFCTKFHTVFTVQKNGKIEELSAWLIEDELESMENGHEMKEDYIDEHLMDAEFSSYS
jgi:hypothetical protein